MRERTRDTVADKYFVVSRILLHPTTSLRLVKCGDKRRVKYGDQHNYLSDIFTAKHIFTSLFQLCRVSQKSWWHGLNDLMRRRNTSCQKLISVQFSAIC